MQRFGYLDVNLRPERSVGVLGGAVVGVQLAQKAESVLRHHLLDPPAVVVAEGEPGVVSRVGAVIVVRLLVRV